MKRTPTGGDGLGCVPCHPVCQGLRTISGQMSSEGNASASLEGPAKQWLSPSAQPYPGAQKYSFFLLCICGVWKDSQAKSTPASQCLFLKELRSSMCQWSAQLDILALPASLRWTLPPAAHSVPSTYKRGGGRGSGKLFPAPQTGLGTLRVYGHRDFPAPPICSSPVWMTC